MKKKIKFNQPKFILPLILLPFLFLAFYGVRSITEEKKITSDLEKVDGINTNIPDASLENNNKSKLEAFKEALTQKRTNTGVDQIGEEGVKAIIVEEDTTTILAQGSSAREKLRQLAQQRIRNEQNRNVQRSSSTPRNSSLGNRTKPQINSKANEMEEFRKQMKFIDSMSNPEKYNRKQALLEKRKLDSIANAQRKEETLKISKTSGQQESYFNTIKANKNETFISAILDEGIKVYRESRVRIRVMDDVFIGDKLIPEGHYLYGTVSNFLSQRVVIKISSIIINDEIIPVDISLYDNDGMEGIYVPNTMFKQFAQELGVQTSSNVSSVDIETDSGSQNPLFEGISTAVQTSSRAIQKALRSNKVRVKYSHKVYLVNNDN